MIYCKKVFGNHGQWWNDRSHKDIELFLQLYNNEPTIKLLKVNSTVSSVTGYTTWSFQTEYKNTKRKVVKI